MAVGSGGQNPNSDAGAIRNGPLSLRPYRLRFCEYDRFAKKYVFPGNVIPRFGNVGRSSVFRISIHCSGRSMMRSFQSVPKKSAGLLVALTMTLPDSLP